MLVGQDIHDQNLSSDSESPGGLGEDPMRVGQVVQDHDGQGRVENPVVDGKLLETARSELHILDPRQSRSSGGQHGFRFVDGDHSSDERGQRQARLSCPASQISDDQLLVEQTQQPLEIETLPEEAAAELGPLLGGSGEELLRSGSATRQGLRSR